MSAHAENEVTQKYIVSNKAIEIDLTIAKFATYAIKSSKNTYESKNHLYGIKAKLVKEQRKH